MGLLSVAAIALGGFMAWRHSKQDATAPMTLDDYPLEEQPRRLRHYMWITGVATALLGAYKKVVYGMMPMSHIAGVAGSQHAFPWH